jgi:hypothetical protein
MHRVRCLTSAAHCAGHAQGTKRMRHILTSMYRRVSSSDYRTRWQRMQLTVACTF